MKVLEFTLPTGSAGMAAGMTRMAIGRRINTIAQQHSIEYTSYLKGYRYYVALTKDSDLSILALQWTSSNPWHRFRVLDQLPPGVERKL